jgi:hypothetical protein
VLKAVSTFKTSIAEARGLSTLYAYLSTAVKVPYSFDDLLRAQVIYAVGAFDKLIHDLIRKGMVAIFSGNRAPTDRYRAEPITIDFHTILLNATFPPKEYLFEQETVSKLARMSFQDPDKVADGLSLIWDEKHKWTKIAVAMSWNAKDAKTKLKLIAGRRNAIVHESDIDPITNAKTPITEAESKDVTDFLLLCGQTIAKLVM